MLTTPPASAASQLGDAEVLLGERHGDPVEVTVGLGGGDDERRAHRRRDPAQGELGHLPPGSPERQRIGELGPPGPLVGVEHVGVLDEHHRDPAGGGDQRLADLPAGDTGVDAAPRRPRRGRARSTSIGGPVSVPASAPARRVATIATRSTASWSAMYGEHAARRQIDPRQVVDEDDDRGRLGGVDEEVAAGDGDGERLDVALAALHRQRRADRRGARRGEVVDTIEHPGEELGEA